ncbi:hypothetical protein Pcinc_007844 [Petrolisthes cinctipes]|uniref:Uncharacterized protein n=1 Tax=Petrolisthes cinctipes TaxID=88211 RepID=A0AAE1KX07_PETCI|nr:hypothetical protein Pcinc_007844 [Petrolisthes cinctipes]
MVANGNTKDNDTEEYPTQNSEPSPANGTSEPTTDDSSTENQPDDRNTDVFLDLSTTTRQRLSSLTKPQLQKYCQTKTLEIELLNEEVKSAYILIEQQKQRIESLEQKQQAQTRHSDPTDTPNFSMNDETNKLLHQLIDRISALEQQVSPCQLLQDTREIISSMIPNKPEISTNDGQRNPAIMEAE